MSQFQSGNSFGDPFGSGSSGGFGGFDQPTYSTPPKPKRYGLHWVQTLIVLLVTAGISFLLMATLNIRYAANPTLTPNLVPFNALFFGILAAAILLTVFFLELIFSAMTPYFSRKLQLLVVVISIALCSLIGALSEVFFVNNYVAPQLIPTPIPVVTATPGPTATPSPTPLPSEEMILFALDKSYSMEGTSNVESVAALNTVIQKISSSTNVGLIVFDHTILDTVSIAPNTTAQRSKISTAISRRVSGGTDFPNVMDTALQMFKSISIPANADAKLVFITDGYGGNTDAYLTQFKQLGIQVSCVTIGLSSMSDLDMVIQGTGGKFVTAKNPQDILNMTQSIVISNTPAPTKVPVTATPSPTPLPKIGNMAYVTPDSDAYLATTFILFGLILGIALTLMLSLQGQLRLQLFLSPLLGLCAFLLIRNNVVSSHEYWMVYAMFGLILMRRNSPYFSSGTSSSTSSRTQNSPASFDNDWNF